MAVEAQSYDTNKNPVFIWTAWIWPKQVQKKRKEWQIQILFKSSTNQSTFTSIVDAFPKIFVWYSHFLWLTAVNTLTGVVSFLLHAFVQQNHYWNNIWCFRSSSRCIKTVRSLLLFFCLNRVFPSAPDGYFPIRLSYWPMPTQQMFYKFVTLISLKETFLKH